MRRSLIAVVLVCCCSAPLRGAPKRNHAITVEDYFGLSMLLQSALSPDGKYVAYTEARWHKDSDNRKADLWVVEVSSKQVRRLTFAGGNDSSPRWSPDSKHIYFLGRRKHEGDVPTQSVGTRPPRDGTTQVWRIKPTGGSPFAVTRVKAGVVAFDLSPDGEQLFYQTDVSKTEGDWKKLRLQFKGIQYGHGTPKVSELWQLDLTSWRADKVIAEGRNIREFKVAGRAVAMITTPDQTVVTFEGRSRVDIFDLDAKKSVTIPDKCFRADAPSPYGWLETLAWSRDASSLAFNVIFDGYPAEVVIARHSEGRWTSTLMKRPEGVQIRGYGSPLAWMKDNDLCFLGEEKARVRLYEARGARQGQPSGYHVRTPGNVVVEGFSVNRSGGCAVVMNDTTHTPDLYLCSGDRGIPRLQLTNLNPQVETWKLPQLSVVSWKGARGDTVEGVLELPPDYRKGDKVPLVVAIHGGPTTATRFHLQYWIYGRTLLPARGYAVLCPNYRGSTGYGDRFLTELVGHENDLDVQDILAGVDALVARGIADPERLGVMGWSNGGYLTNCLISRTTRFKAASSGAGIVDTVMEWGSNDEPAYAIVFKKGLPWSNPEQYRRTSSTYALNKVRTPTLIHVGGGDERCPPSQSRMLYRALKEYVKVPTELLVYPGEPHGLTKYSHREAKLRWDLAWFDRYILGKTAR